MVAFSELKPSATGLELDVRVDGTNDKSSSIITPPLFVVQRWEQKWQRSKLLKLKTFSL